MNRRNFEKRKVPAYMTTFGDMMTLILTFFVLLVSSAIKLQVGFVARGTGSVVRAIDAFGLPGLLRSGTKPITLSKPRSHFRSRIEAPCRITRAAPSGHRILDPVEHKLTEDMVQRINKGVEVGMPTDIDFLPGTLDLTPKSKRFLDSMIRIARANACDIEIHSHIVAMAGRGRKASYRVSTRRAQAVADYLHNRGRIARARLTAIGYGCFRPMVHGNDARQDEANERIEIIFCKPAAAKRKGA
ncbi:MAG: OmpA/MotB family protein [Alphaproteobacteria bacterium]